MKPLVRKPSWISRQRLRDFSMVVIAQLSDHTIARKTKTMGRLSFITSCKPSQTRSIFSKASSIRNNHETFSTMTRS